MHDAYDEKVECDLLTNNSASTLAKAGEITTMKFPSSTP